MNDPQVERVMKAVAAGDRRLTIEEALRLYHEAPLPALGRWATAACDRWHGDRVRTFVKDRNVNYTNACSARCTFCAFYRKPGDAEAYTLDEAALHEKVAELVAVGGRQVLLQGGMNPDLPIEFYEAMLSGLKRRFPEVHLHAFSPPEFVEFVSVFEIAGFPTPGVGGAVALAPEMFEAKLARILERLVAAGLDSIPGGGGEIFAPHVRERIGLGKASDRTWLSVMRVAHRFGLCTSATMMFGHIEGVRDRFEHMARIREAQDAAAAEGDAGRYLSFISWPFQPENTPLGRLPEWDSETESVFPGDELADRIAAGGIDPLDPAAWRRAVPQAGRVRRSAGASEYLRMQAIARLFLDNIPHIGSSWVTMGPHIGQLGLFYGADDMGSIMMEENVVSAAGTTYCLDEALLCHLIREAGYIPAERDNAYRHLAVHEGPASADLAVEDWSTHRVGALATEDGSAGPVALSIEGTGG